MLYSPELDAAWVKAVGRMVSLKLTSKCILDVDVKTPVKDSFEKDFIQLVWQADMPFLNQTPSSFAVCSMTETQF
jgi:hypothetical protein